MPTAAKQDGLEYRPYLNQMTSTKPGAVQRLSTKDYFLEFKSTGAVEQSMRVRWITRITPNNGAWIYQISVLHTAPARVPAKQFFSEEVYSNFFDEFHPE